MTGAPPPELRVRFAIAGILVGLLAGTGAHGTSQDADPGRRSVPEYAEWARQVVASPPAGISLVPALEDELAGRVGEQRREHDLPTMQPDPDLQLAARAHAIEMLERGYLGHVSPDGHTVAGRVGILHRRFIGSTGENLAEHTGLAHQAADQTGPLALKLMSGFLESPEHRENLLDPDFTHHGVGAAGQGERVVVVHVFGARRAALQRDLPLQVPEGAELPLAFGQGQGLSAPEKYGFGRAGQRSAETMPLDVALNEVAVGPGTDQLQFFLPTEHPDRYEVANGPAIIVQ